MSDSCDVNETTCNILRQTKFHQDRNGTRQVITYQPSYSETPLSTVAAEHLQVISQSFAKFTATTIKFI